MPRRNGSGPQGLLSASDLLARGRSSPRETLEIPELGGSVILQCITAGERGVYYRTLFNDTDVDRIMRAQTLLVAMSLVDATGARLYTNDDAAQFEHLRGDLLGFLFQRCYALSKLGNEHVQQLGTRLRSDPIRRSLFRLAERLGMTVAELSSRMDSQELAEWFALSFLDQKYDEMVTAGTDPKVAAKAIWETAAKLS